MKVFHSFLFVIFLHCIAAGQLSSVSLPIDEKFSTDAEVEYTESQVPRSYLIGKIRGVEYRYFHDTSRGTVEGTKGHGIDSVFSESDPKNWRFNCQRSEKSGQNQCLFSKEGITIITYTTDRATGTFIANTNFHRNDQNLSMFADIVQVDGVDIYDSRKKQFSPDALSLLRSGTVLILRRGPEPEGVTTHSLHGFNEALDLSEWAIKHVFVGVR